MVRADTSKGVEYHKLCELNGIPTSKYNCLYTGKPLIFFFPPFPIPLSLQVSGYPGQKLELGFTALDELNRETAVVVRLSDQSTVNFMSEASVSECVSVCVCVSE